MRLKSKKAIFAAFLITLFVILTTASGFAESEYDDDDVYWDNSMSLPIPRLKGVVNAIVYFNGELIAGGEFTISGSEKACNIARWDGSEWVSLGSGTDAPVKTLMVYNENLIAGGEFTSADGILCEYIALWDGNEWFSLNSGMDGPVYALTEYGGNLVAGGQFAIPNIDAEFLASWNGDSWSSIPTITDSTIYSLAVFNDELIVPIWRDPPRSMQYKYNIASWNGSSWTLLSNIGFNGDIRTMVVYSGSLIVGGEFTIADGKSVGFVTYWNGSVWSDDWEGYNGPVLSMATYSNILIMGGEFTYQYDPYPRQASYITARGGWTYYSLGTNGPVRAILPMGDSLFVGGDFTIAGDAAAEGIACRLDFEWIPIGWGETAVRALASYNGCLVAGGTFGSDNGFPSENIAMWDGSSWQPIGGDLNGTVYALIEYDGKLYAGGAFTSAGGVAAGYIAAWDGTSWAPLGPGFGYTVYDFSIHEGKLVVCGSGGYPGQIDYRFIGSWDGSEWSVFEERIHGVDIDIVYSVCSYDGMLFAGGYHGMMTGSPHRYLAAWDGSDWIRPNDILLDNRVKDMIEYHGELIVGGWFVCYNDMYNSKDFLYAEGAVRWDGSEWNVLEEWFGASVECLEVYDDQLILGGRVSTSYPHDNGGVVAWNGSEKIYLGSGVNERVYAATVYDNKLIVGGEFNTAGGKPAAYVAAWTKEPTDVNEPGDPSLPVSFNLSQNYPNPFNPMTTIEFELPRRSQVSIDIFNILGQKITGLVDKQYPAGSHSVVWDGVSSEGKRVSTGIYFYRLKTDDFTAIRKMLLLK